MEYEDIPLALICAVALEAEPLHAMMSDARPHCVGRKPGVLGRLDGVPVLALAAGMGKANAAQGLTAVLETHEIRGVIGYGVAGAYPGSSLDTADIALASRIVYGDEGVETPDGWRGTDEIGIPLLDQGEVRRFNEFPLAAARVEAARAALETSGLRTKVGTFVTVSCCSGTAERGAALAARWGAVCETMESAAIAHVCALYDVPLLEVRGVSNIVEDRNPARWRLNEATVSAARAARVLAREWHA